MLTCKYISIIKHSGSLVSLFLSVLSSRKETLVSRFVTRRLQHIHWRWKRNTVERTQRWAVWELNLHNKGDSGQVRSPSTSASLYRGLDDCRNTRTHSYYVTILGQIFFFFYQSDVQSRHRFILFNGICPRFLAAIINFPGQRMWRSKRPLYVNKGFKKKVDILFKVLGFWYN